MEKYLPEINNLFVTPCASKARKNALGVMRENQSLVRDFCFFVKIFHLIWIQDICDNSSDNDQAIHILYFPGLCTFKKSKYLID